MGAYVADSRHPNRQPACLFLVAFEESLMHQRLPQTTAEPGLPTVTSAEADCQVKRARRSQMSGRAWQCQRGRVT